MSRKHGRTSRPISALLLGLAATAAVAAGHLAGLDRPAELQTLDMRFRHLATAPANDLIVRVDIDDRSLAEVGHWPWPRRRLAGIVEMLQQCRARAVVLDIILPEPQEIRYVSASADVIEADFSEILGDAPPQPIFDDSDLADAISGQDNVFVPMYMDLAPAETADEGEHIARGVDEILSADGQADFASVLRAVLPNVPADARTAGRETARRAYLRKRAMDRLWRFGIDPDRAAGYPARTGTIVPPVVTFADAIRHSGFVTVVPDADGVVRRICLLAQSGDRLYGQFAFALAAWELASHNGGGYGITANADAVTIRFSDAGLRKIPVDADGMMLINWIRPAPGRAAMRHIPARAVELVFGQREKLRRNKNCSRLAYIGMARILGQADMLELFARADELYRRRVSWQTHRQRAVLYDPGSVPARPAGLAGAERQVEEKLDELCAALRESLDSFYLKTKPAPPDTAGLNADDAAAQQREYVQARADYDRLVRLRDLADRIDAENAHLLKRFGELLAELAGIVGGKICMIGSTATGAADFVPTPMGNRTPGVAVHANILNTIVSGAFVRQAGTATNVLVILLAGVVVSLLAANRPVLQAVPLTAVAAAAYAAFNGLVIFGVWNYWLTLVAPLAAMLASLLVVTAYRQLTEERAKRYIRGMFAHAMSPALVDRLIEDPSLARLGGERRVLSCFFSDLAGFTPLAEKLGEQQTVQLLNRYFDRLTEVIQNRCGGYLNKFLGDGLFVFFGAPVFQDDHAARAIRAAVDCVDEIEQLNGELAAESAGLAKLVSRVGIATGDVMVGNCGSSERMDYTAIGDAVNLASRLETANKFFGTHVLVADETWRLGRQETILARPIGRIVVVGRSEAEAVWNIVGTKAQASDKTQQAMADFAAGLRLYEGQNFAAAAGKFQEVLELLGDDRPARIYLDLCREYLSCLPPAGWDGVMRLTEK